jgi:hypothetical protein
VAARSITEKQIKAAIKKGLGAAGKKYDLDETYTSYLVGVKSGRGSGAPAPIPTRHEAGVLERFLQLENIPAQMCSASRDGYWIEVPKIVAAT